MKYILLEQKILLFSREPEHLATLTESLLSLTCPLKFSGVYIPHLRIEMHEVLHALMPFLIGMDSRYKQQVLSSIDSEDMVIFDVDHNMFIRQQKHIRLPAPLKHYMQGVSLQGEVAMKVLQLKSVYSNLMLGLINNILPFLGETFDYKGYMGMFPEDRLFYEHFSVHSMMFNHFIEEVNKNE